jgi:uncharacterized protein
MPDLTIRPIGAADLLAIVALNDAEVPKVSPLGGDALAEHLERCELSVVAEDGAGQLAGFLLALAPGRDYASVNYRFFVDRGTDFLYIDRVVVAPSHRRQGVARRLYAAVVQRAAVDGREAVTCEVNVRPPNPASLAFHADLGFVEVGRQDTTGGTLTVALLAKPIGDPGPDVLGTTTRSGSPR